MQGRTTLRVLLGASVLLTVPLAGCLGGGPAPVPPPEDPTLGPPEGPERNATGNESVDRRHAHDRWFNPATGEAVDRIVLVDTTLTVEPYNGSEPLLVEACERDRGGPGQARTCLGWAEAVPGTWPDGTPKVVPPGTGRLEVTLTFRPDAFAGMDLWVQHRNSQGRWTRFTNASTGGPFGPGGDARVLEPITMRMSDDGHAQVSSWMFGIAPYETPYLPAETGLLDGGSGDLDVLVVAHRAAGELPLEPPHPAFWEADDPPTHAYRIGRMAGATDGFVQVGPVTAEPGQGAAPRTSGHGLVWQVPVGFEGTRIEDAKARYDAKLEGDFDAALVPPASRLLVVHVTVENARVEAGNPRVCVLGQEVPGEGFPDGRDRQDKGIGECRPFADGTHRFQRSLVDRDTDSYYVNASAGISMSRWTLYVQVVPEPLPGGQRSAASFAGEVRAQVFVTDRTAFEMPAWAEAGADAEGF